MIKIPYPLEFIEIPPEDKEVFKARFAAYLEEIDLLVGKSVEPEFEKRFPEYDSFFTDDPNKRPFLINLIRDPEQIGVGKENVGFFFLKLITPEDFPSEIQSIYEDEDDKIAWLTDFYLFPNRRGSGYAWKFYNSIINLATDPLNKWHVAWECDIENEPAIAFYEKVLERIRENHKYNMSKIPYTKDDGREYYFYQVKFEFD